MCGTGDVGARLYSTKHWGLNGERCIAVCSIGCCISRSERVLVGIGWLPLNTRKKKLLVVLGVLSWAGGNTPWSGIIVVSAVDVSCQKPVQATRNQEPESLVRNKPEGEDGHRHAITMTISKSRPHGPLVGPKGIVAGPGAWTKPEDGAWQNETQLSSKNLKIVGGRRKLERMGHLLNPTFDLNLPMTARGRAPS
jgi:hypothetical protein